MSAYTIIAEAGDNGMKFAVGTFSTLDAAAALASEWQEGENPERDPNGMHYAAARIQPIREWTEMR